MNMINWPQTSESMADISVIIYISDHYLKKPPKQIGKMHNNWYFFKKTQQPTFINNLYYALKTPKTSLSYYIYQKN